jgi:Flp pilus assembly protein TadG
MMISQKSKFMRRTSRSSDGQALVEFAIILPLILLVVLGLIEFGILFYNKAMVTNASREGARAGIVHRTDPISGAYTPLSKANIEKVVQDYLASKLITFNKASVPIIDPNPTSGDTPFNGGSGSVDVFVRYTHTYLIAGKFLGLGNGIQLTGETIMRLQ